VPLSDTTEGLFDELFDINAKGAYFTIQKALPFLNDGASIILNTSIMGEKGQVNASVYSATKAALRSFVPAPCRVSEVCNDATFITSLCLRYW